jgi:hypothetical protein
MRKRMKEKLMKLEECTKSELIWFIKRRCFYESKDLEFDVLMYRAEKIRKASADEFKNSNDALGRYIELLKPYEGKPLFSIPDALLHKATAEMEIRETAIKRYESLEKRYNALQARIDSLLDEKEEKSNEGTKQVSFISSRPA